ncbi:YciI family protein [Propionispora hippei]|uniref:Uncharacterized conserved protein YciI, contains a putative active-site phosphohistidine n=1 Tax=Propionispora hippei DSM 15287 TaxID=1123003 RepID=A0A1M6DX19_9FIRM|nr:YciI family protein [Propionispora hippei]SHI77693.1 Uncharacterized conserved protein YciI, contains a putative active-site phosphohistidine [Propionispora hippei DSM 15287]
MFVIILKYVKPLEVIDELIPGHIVFLDACYDKGIFLMSGRQNPREGGIILAQANSRAEIDAIIKHDPFYTNQAAEYTVIEFLPSKCAAGLESLIKP